MSNESLESALSGILGNEELMSKISSIVGAHSGNKEEALPEVVEAISSTLGNEKDDEKDENVSGSVQKRGSSMNSLLVALRPYLSEKRASLIDQLLKLEGLTEILKLTR